LLLLLLMLLLLLQRRRMYELTLPMNGGADRLKQMPLNVLVCLFVRLK
jgi:hypothetical protein